MRDLPNPSLIDTPYSPEPVKEKGDSWVTIGLITALFVAFILLCGFLDVRMQFS